MDERSKGVVYESPTVEIEGRPLRRGEEPRRFSLEVLDGDQKGVLCSFEKKSVRLGNDPLNDLVLTDRTVSRRHCEVRQEGRQYKLVDLNSTNGTFLKELKIGEASLPSGGVFRVGQTRVRFRTEESELDEEEVRSRYPEIVGRSNALQDIFSILDKVAPSDLSVVIEGETGTGKELIAQALHKASRRAKAPLVVFDCSAFPPTLLESELFGHERGAFSGATYTHRGVFERADGGTIFFDELAEMDPDFQPRFLRVLESGTFRRVGGERTIRVDVRVVAATNRNLDQRIEEGLFRKDLFYRLAKVRFRLPPLRERREDIALLASHFLGVFAHTSSNTLRLSPEAENLLKAHQWPGNIRELRNVVERAATFAAGEVITAEELRNQMHEAMPREKKMVSAPLVSPLKEAVPLREAKDQLVSDFERQYLEQLLEKHGQNVSAAAREAQVDRRHFYRLLKKYDLMR